MTGTQLEAAHKRRAQLWRAMAGMAPGEGGGMIAERQRLDAAIVAELRRRGEPVQLPGRTWLWLARDRDGYAECDETGLPLVAADRRHADQRVTRALLHDYKSQAVAS
jgi:hypothetical protein